MTDRRSAPISSRRACRRPPSRPRCHSTKPPGHGSRSLPRMPEARLRFPHPPSAASPWQGRTRTMEALAVGLTTSHTGRCRPAVSIAIHSRCSSTLSGCVVSVGSTRTVAGSCMAIVRGRRPAAGAGTASGQLRWVARERGLRRWLTMAATTASRHDVTVGRPRARSSSSDRWVRRSASLFAIVPLCTSLARESSMRTMPRRCPGSISL